MPGLSKVIVLDPDVRAGRQLQLGFEREGVPTATIPANTATLEPPGDDTGLVVVGGIDDRGLELIRKSRAWLDGQQIDAPILFAGRGVERRDAEAAGASEIVLPPAYLRDVVTIGRLLLGAPSPDLAHLTGSLAEVTGVFTLVRALAAMGRSATLSLTRGLRRGEIRFYHGEVTSAQVGMIHGQAALHQLLLWTDARFDFHHEDIVRRQQIPLTHEELFADAERFLESVRDSSGALSPSMVLEQDIPRVQSFGKQIPTEVYGVLRMFDGYRVLSDVLEDSAYRVFETLRVTQRAVDVGLLRVINKQPQRVSWRAILSIEEWLIGSETRETGSDSGPIIPQGDGPAAREPGPAKPRDQRGKGARKPRRKKKRRLNTPPAIPAGAVTPSQSETIDWGALVPRIVGAEVGPLAGVVPAAHVSGEIVATPPLHALSHPDEQPTVVFDEAAELARHTTAEAESRAEAEAEAARADTEAARADTEARAQADADADGAAAHAHALRVIAATVSLSQDSAHVVDDLVMDDTKPQRLFARAKPDETTSAAVEDSVEGSGEITERVTVTPEAPVTPEAQAAEPAVPSTSVSHPTPEGGAIAAAAPAEITDEGATITAAAPAEITDDPSDGVIRQHITSADTAPVKRRRVPTDPPEDDRPGDAMGEITAPRARPAEEPEHREPSILVSDLAAVHAAVSAIANGQAAAPATIDAASPSREAPIDETRSDAVAFSALEEEFFREGHETAEAVVATSPTIESFDDLDEGYQPVGFWDRLRGKAARDPHAPPMPDEPEPEK